MDRIRSSWDRTVQKAQAGSDGAFEELAEHCRNYLLHLANRELPAMLRGKVAPSDLVQESLLAAHNGLPEFRGKSLEELLAWLRVILRHCVETHRRRFIAQKRNVAYEVSLALGNTSVIVRALPDQEASPSQVLASQEDVARVMAAIQKLPQHCQEVVLLRNRDGKTLQEIGEQTGRSPEAVRKIWTRSIERLRVLLDA